MPWTAEHIGSISTPVYAAYDGNGGAFVLTGSSGISSGTADSMSWLHRTWYGDGEFVIRVVDLPNAAGFAQAGIVLRESTDPGAVSANLFLTSEGQAVFSMRSAANGSTATVGTLEVGAPAWLKLKRTGNQINGYASKDGTTWSLVGNVVQPLSSMMNSKTEMGLASSAITSRPSTTVLFDNLSLAGTDSNGNGLPDAWELAMFGNLSQTANGDSDGDGLTNLQEFQYGLNPIAADNSASILSGVAPIPVNLTPGLGGGVLEHSVWLNVPGDHVMDLTHSAAFASFPNIRDSVSGAAVPLNTTQNTGQRLRGTVTAPVTGDYTFWISADNSG